MRKFLTILIIIIPFFCTAQKQGNIWYFGDSAGVSFNSGSPVTILGGKTGTDIPYNIDNQEGTSCVSDSAGNILFYTGGQTIWNRNNIPMPNGTGIMGGVSSTQSSLIIPLPGSDSIFYLFTSDEFQSFPNSKGYRYTVVDMCLNKGIGDVVTSQKNILLLDSSTEKLAACEDASGSGYWIVGHKMFSDEFNAWHLTSGGITNTIVTHIGTIHGWNSSNSTWNSYASQGQMKLNSTGTKLALAIGNFDPAYLDLFDFNDNTGIISNYCHLVIDSALNKYIYGVEFSPDGSKVYVTIFNNSGTSQIFQYDILAGVGNCDSIKASCFNLFQSNNNLRFMGMQCAPNNKIYVVSSVNQLGCINFPDSSKLAANFDSIVISPGNTWNYMLPSFIAGYKYHNGIINCLTDEIVNVEKIGNIDIYPNPTINNFTIETPQFSTIEISNIEGQIIKTLTSVGTKTNFDVSSFLSGVYIVEVKTEKGIAMKKFIKE